MIYIHTYVKLVLYSSYIVVISAKLVYYRWLIRKGCGQPIVSLFSLVTQAAVIPEGWFQIKALTFTYLLCLWLCVKVHSINLYNKHHF